MHRVLHGVSTLLLLICVCGGSCSCMCGAVNCKLFIGGLNDTREGPRGLLMFMYLFLECVRLHSFLAASPVVTRGVCGAV